MRRIIIQGLLAWLIGLLPLLAAGQTLSRYEYWFDNDFAHRVSGSLSGTEREVNKRVSTDGLSDGIHRINFRARQSDGSYSAITSSVFLKLDKPANTVLEYWFDDNYDQRESIPISANGEEESLSLDLRSNTKYPFGFHWLKLRAAVAGAGTTSVCTEPVLKLSAGVANKLDYWIDGDISNMRTLEGNNASDGNGYVYVTDLDLQDVSPGYHRLYCRTRSSSGYTSSAVTMTPFIKVTSGIASTLEYWVDNDRSNVRTLAGVPASDGNGYVFTSQLDMRSVDPGYHVLYFRARSENGGTSTSTLSSGFLKLASGAASRLEYWLDGDRSNVRVLNGTQASDGNGYVFVDDLDLGDVTPGHHRLYCRARSGSGGTATAVTMTPIIVKSRYYHDENEVAVMKKYSISVDDEEPVINDVLRPKEEFPYNGSLDARYLSQGQHTLKATFWNSVGTSVSVEQPFTVKLPEPGEITLTADEHDGLVKLEYNNVPNNVKHSVLRAGKNGKWFPVHTVKQSCSADAVSHYVDIPSAAGTYTYKVKSRYENFDGSTDVVESNVVTVNVARTKDELTNYGYIIGQVPDMYPLIKHAYFSDGEHVPFTGCHFSRELIPVGKELTIEVIESSDSETYYKPVTLTVKAGENLVNFEPLAGNERPYYDEHHLEFASDLEWTGMNFTFDVKCHASKTWKGRVRLRVISKKEYEQNNGDTGSGSLDPSGDAGTQAGAVAPMPNVEVQKNYYYSYSEPFTLDPGKTTTVTLSLDNLFPDKKKEHYLCFFESEGQWRDGVESMDEIRLLETNNAYNVTENPQDRLIDKNLLEQAKDEIAMQDAEYAANLILMVATYIKGFDGILGKTIDVCDYIKDVSSAASGLTEADYNALMAKALTTMGSFDEFLGSEVVQKAPVAAFANMGSALTQVLRDDIAKDIIKYGKGVHEYLGKAMTVLKYVKEYQNWEQMNTYERSFYCMNAILDAYEKTNPFAALVKPYDEVGKSMIAKALDYGEIYNAGYEAQDLYEGKIKFKIKVQTNMLVDFNFAYHGTSAIREVKVMAANRDEWNKTMVDTIYFEPKGVWNGVELRQTRYAGIDPSRGTGNLEFGKPLQRLWMEIKWKNGRTSKIPLVGKNEEIGVNYSTLDRRYTVHFKSETTKYKNIADVIQLTNHKTL
jgi:hypothetical protein